MGKLADPHTVAVEPIDGGDPHMLKTKNVVLATGSEPTPFMGGALQVRRHSAKGVTL